MIVRVISHFLMAASIVQFFPVDGAILEWQAGAAQPPEGFAQTFVYGPLATLPQARNKVPDPPIKTDLQSFGVVTSAQSVVVIDAASGATLYAKNPNEVRSIGSISKLMSALVFLDTQPDLNRQVTVTPEDFAGTGRVYLYYNDAVRLRDVLGASLVGSDNTATLALVRLSGLSEEDFVAKMNTKAIALGMTQTRFDDPSGLSEHNQSTVGELAILLHEAKQYTEITQFMVQDVFTVSQASGREVAIPSTNQLLTSSVNRGDYQITAGKTGFIPQAGYCLATAIKFNEHEIYVIVLGAEEIDDRFTDAISLATWVYKVFSWPKL
jgi:serine-type D-Ala-D-Ala endopeptidase (penicillin-binding protein 7)